jgi:hypothetical protein
MAETRRQYTTALTIQLDNPIHGTQFNGAPMLSRINVIMNGETPVFQQAGQIMEPAIATDLTPELVEQMNARLVRLGFKLVAIDE